MLFGRDDVGLVASVFGGGGEMFEISVFEGIFSAGGFSVGTVTVREDTDRGSRGSGFGASDSNSIFFLIQLSL